MPVHKRIIRAFKRKATLNSLATQVFNLRNPKSAGGVTAVSEVQAIKKQLSEGTFDPSSIKKFRKKRKGLDTNKTGYPVHRMR